MAGSVGHGPHSTLRRSFQWFLANCPLIKRRRPSSLFLDEARTRDVLSTFTAVLLESEEVEGFQGRPRGASGPRARCPRPVEPLGKLWVFRHGQSAVGHRGGCSHAGRPLPSSARTRGTTAPGCSAGPALRMWGRTCPLGPLRVAARVGRVPAAGIYVSQLWR